MVSGADAAFLRVCGTAPEIDNYSPLRRSIPALEKHSVFPPQEKSKSARTQREPGRIRPCDPAAEAELSVFRKLPVFLRLVYIHLRVAGVDPTDEAEFPSARLPHANVTVTQGGRFVFHTAKRGKVAAQRLVLLAPRVIAPAERILSALHAGLVAVVDARHAGQHEL